MPGLFFLRSVFLPLTLFVALAGILLAGLTALLATLLAGLLTALALLLATLLARALLVLAFLLLTFLARLLVLVHWSSKDGVIPAFGFNPCRVASFRWNPMVPKVSLFTF